MCTDGSGSTFTSEKDETQGACQFLPSNDTCIQCTYQCESECQFSSLCTNNGNTCTCEYSTLDTPTGHCPGRYTLQQPSTHRAQTPANHPLHPFRHSRRPELKPYHGIAALDKPAHANSTHVGQALSWVHPTTGKHVKLNYSAKYSDQAKIVNIDLVPEVVSIKCEPDKATLYLVSSPTNPVALSEVVASLADQLESGLLTGRPDWNCARDDTNAPGVILRRVLSVGKQEVGYGTAVVELTTERATYTHFFEHAAVRFSASAIAPGHAHQYDAHHPEHAPLFGSFHADAQNQQHQSRRAAGAESNGLFGWIKHAVNDVWGAVKHVAKDVEKGVVACYHAVKVVLTGDYDFGKAIPIASISWNTDDGKTARNQTIVIDPAVTCTDCFLEIDSSLNFDLDIEGFELEHTALYLEGNMNTHVNGTLDVQYEFAYANQTELAVIHLKKVCFSIGVVPVCLMTSIHISVGYQVDLKAAATIQAQGAATGSIKYGFQLLRDSSGLHYHNLHDNEFTHTGSMNAGAQVSVSASIYVLPTIVLNVDDIGGGSVGVKGIVEPTLLLETPSPCSSTGLAGAKFVLNWGLQVAVGAQLDIGLQNHPIYKHDWGPWQIVSIKHPLLSGCVHTSAEFEAMTRNDSRLALLGISHPTMGGFVTHVHQGPPYLFHVGATYSGVIKPKPDAPPSCGSTPTMIAALQYTSDDSSPRGYPTWSGNVNHNYAQSNKVSTFNWGCVNQAEYEVESGTLSLSTDLTVHMKNCTTEETNEPDLTKYLHALGGAYSLSQDFSTMTIDSSDPSCLDSPFILYRI